MGEYATQNERVLRHLMEHGTVSLADTLRWSPPITRLAARIADLKAAGKPVAQVGKAGKFASYGLTAPVVTPAPRPACPVCLKPLEDVRETISKDVVNGRCLTHGNQLVVVR